MKHISKSISLFLAIFMLLTCTTTAFASEKNNGLTENPTYMDEGISTYGTEKPTKIWNLSQNGKNTYYFSGWSNMSTLYSEYLFTGAKSVTIQVTNSSTNNLTVKLLKKQTGIDWSSSTRSGIKPGDTLRWTVDSLSASSQYYLQFSSGCKVSGYIKYVR